MATRKVTISLEAADLAWIERRARRLNGGNLSAAFVDGLQALRRREALEDFLGCGSQRDGSLIAGTESPT
jgi:hypothetical protein